MKLRRKKRYPTHLIKGKFVELSVCNTADKERSEGAYKQPESNRLAGKRLVSVKSAAYEQTCRHWCHNGICKWGAKCRYRHSMPMTLNGLQEVGLGNWPNWYRKANMDRFAPDAPDGTRGRQRKVGAFNSNRRRESSNVRTERKAPSDTDEISLSSLRTSSLESRPRERRRKCLWNESRAQSKASHDHKDIISGVDDRMVRAETKAWENDKEDGSIAFYKEKRLIEV